MTSIAQFRPESRGVVAIGLVVGLLAIWVVPPVSTFDGPGHYFRAVQIARGHFRATRYSERQLGGGIPEKNSRFVHTLWASYWPSHHFMTVSGWSAISVDQPGDDKKVLEEFTNTAVYSPANYVPQSLALVLSRIITGSPLWDHRAACMLNLLCYLALIVLALETMPRFQTGLLLVASSPLLLIQAATLNIDGINFAVPMCIYGLVWRMRSEPASDHRLSLAAATCLALWTTLLKPTEVVCLGFLCFIPDACFGSRSKKVAWLVVTLGLTASLWLFWNRPYLDINIAGWFEPSHPAITTQKTWLLHHPRDFFRAFGVFIRRDLFDQWKSSYCGVGGWIPEWVESLVSRLSYLFLVVLALESAQDAQHDGRWAAISLAHAAGLLLLIAVTLWVSYGIRDTDHIPYLGGRYLFLVFTFSFIALSAVVPRLPRVTGKYLLATGLVVNVLSLALILVPTALRVTE
jgi:hypothetical protein